MKKHFKIAHEPKPLNWTEDKDQLEPMLHVFHVKEKLKTKYM